MVDLCKGYTYVLLGTATSTTAACKPISQQVGRVRSRIHYIPPSSGRNWPRHRQGVPQQQQQQYNGGMSYDACYHLYLVPSLYQYYLPQLQERLTQQLAGSTTAAAASAVRWSDPADYQRPIVPLPAPCSNQKQHRAKDIICTRAWRVSVLLLSVRGMRLFSSPCYSVEESTAKKQLSLAQQKR